MFRAGGRAVSRITDNHPNTHLLPPPLRGRIQQGDLRMLRVQVAFGRLRGRLCERICVAGYRGMVGSENFGLDVRKFRTKVFLSFPIKNAAQRLSPFRSLGCAFSSKTRGPSRMPIPAACGRT